MLNINGEYWKVVLVPPYHPALNNQVIGVCDDNLKTIYISDILSLQKTKKVLCHELVHAIVFSYNIQLNINQEERLADAIASLIIGET